MGVSPLSSHTTFLIGCIMLFLFHYSLTVLSDLNVYCLYYTSLHYIVFEFYNVLWISVREDYGNLNWKKINNTDQTTCNSCLAALTETRWNKNVSVGFQKEACDRAKDTSLGDFITYFFVGSILNWSSVNSAWLCWQTLKFQGRAGNHMYACHDCTTHYSDT